jgi:UTP--glucose-1-phosphate uridylyltransferase
LVEGKTGHIAEADIQPVESLPDAETLPAAMRAQGEASISKTVLIKLNGGLGTGMGLECAKSLLPVRDGLSFLDIIALQAEHDRIPLVLMNSRSTEKESLDALRCYEPVDPNLPRSFLQHQEPKVTRDDLTPVKHPKNPDLEWCPPGHGDIYLALLTSRTLERLLTQGYRYAFVSNADNLGAVFDPAILGYLVQRECPFLMEVAERTPMDRKGGHLARRDGKFILRESAQCSPADEGAFQNIQRHRYFNTNSLWVDLTALDRKMREVDNNLRLPLIRNAKTVDPKDPDSEPVIQLETAMGAAIEVFDKAEALRVPRTRFAPVKGTNELLLVRSDVYQMTDGYRLALNPARTVENTTVKLDPRYYKFIKDLEARFPFGPPSLIDCQSLSIEGDYTFGQDVVCQGHVSLEPPGMSIPAGRTISGA